MDAKLLPVEHPSPSLPKRPYRSPELIRLGTVRELTLTGGPTLISDGVSPTKKTS